jgi:2-aminoethylphosphonate-pyruvate transaminase
MAIKTAVIMAAGLGTRFGSRTESIPKGFVPFKGEPMVVRSIQSLIASGIERIIIGTGFRKEAYEALSTVYPQIECVYSPRFAETNSMYTLYNCREAVGYDDFLLLESDLVYESKALSLLIEHKEPTIMLITPVTKFQDQYYVTYDECHRLTMCSTDKNQLEVKGELVGIHKISNSFFRAMCDDYATKVDEMPKLGYEYELLAMARKGNKVYVLNEVDLQWYEIDDLADLTYAEKIKDL